MAVNGIDGIRLRFVPSVLVILPLALFRDMAKYFTVFCIVYM